MKIVITTKERGSKYMGNVTYISEKKDILVIDNLIILDKEGDFKVASKSDTKRTFKISKLSKIERVN